MTIVLVHGNPETPAVWGPLLDALDTDRRAEAVCLSPPGFGAPVPGGFGATVEDYRRWLVGELEAFDGPVDLVGHDWGGGHVLTVAMTRPDLMRSWASDVLGLFDPDYVWHDLAQAWQTPGVGEEHVAAMLGGSDADRVGQMTGLGIPRDVAEAMAPEQDAAMRDCILALYRSAAQPAMAEWGRGLPNAAQRPGLALVATADGFVGVDGVRERAAARAGAQTATLDGLGHWWMLEDPSRGAAALTAFWASLPR